MSASTQAKRILVTGGAGFLGSHLCKHLIDQGEEILCLDNFYTGSKQNIASLLNHPRFELIRHDISFPLYTEVDEIYNLACPASPLHYQRDPIQTTKTGILGAINMLGLAKRLDCKILQASTSEIYGDPQCHPQTESYWGHVNPIGPRACYDESKRCAETLFFDYHQQHQTKIKVARIFNTYGPNMQVDDGRVISNFITQALGNATLTLYGNGQQSRCFCYVDDMVEALVRLMATDDNFTGPVNLGSTDETSMHTLAQTIIGLTGSKARITQTQAMVDDPVRRKPDISLAEQALDWQPTTPFQLGIEKTIAYFRGVLNAGPDQSGNN